MNLTLKIWRQKNARDKGKLVEYKVTDISEHMSFLEMMDVLNEQLVEEGKVPVAFDHDCREGICGMCSLFINGELTQGENIADLGGLIVSYNAFKKTEQYKTRELIDGLTPSQRFYLNSAQVWKGSIRDEALELRIKTDPHSPAKYRVIGSLSKIGVPTFGPYFQANDERTKKTIRFLKNENILFERYLLQILKFYIEKPTFFNISTNIIVIFYN